MCGIAGLMLAQGDPAKEVALMTSKLNHRGPDASNVYCEKNLALGHSRLAILDTSSRADQPFEDNDVVLVFNGEIYNFDELKRQYFKHDVFRTASDTEVLIKLYQRFGIERTLKEINGMFAFALLDRKLKTLFLCRDKVGKKPLYYFSDSQMIAFASETKCFESLKSLNLDFSVFNDALYSRYSVRLSPYENIEMLENGCYVSIDIEQFSIEHVTYFCFEDLIDQDSYNYWNSVSEKEVLQELENLLHKSIRLRLHADVSVATVNSGGLDSSLVSFLASQQQQVDMYHIDVEGMSELKYAELLAKRLGGKLIVKKLTEKGLKENIDQVILHYEYPLVHPNAYGILLLSELAKENGVRVLLSGDGADELFGGYNFYRRAYKTTFFPSLFVRSINKLSGYFKREGPPLYSEAIIESDRRIKRIEKKLSFIKNKRERYVQALLQSSLSEYLQPLNLRTDKLSMANSVEIRSPFLDINVIKFALNLPLRYKLNFFEGKVALKKLAKNKLPKEIITRPKAGFGTPMIEKAKVNSACGSHQNYVLYSYDVFRLRMVELSKQG